MVDNVPLDFINAIKAVVHKDFNPITLQNNIGILFFQPNTFTGAAPVLPTVDTAVGPIFFVDGFGVVNNDGDVSNTLNRASLFTFDFQKCEDVFGSEIANENILCAMCSGAICNRVCSGDQGGALVNLIGGVLVTYFILIEIK